MAEPLAFPTPGVWIRKMTSTGPHPLDTQVEGVRNRSEDAFRVVYLATVDDLVSFAFGMVSDLRTAEDIVQQTFVELVRAAPKIRGDGKSLRAWLFHSVRYGCLDEYRRRSRRPEVLAGDIPDRAAPDGVEVMQLEPALETALLSLTPRHRTVVVLRHVVGLSGEEIARVIKTSRRAAYAVLSRAEANLRRSLEESR